MLQGSHQTRPDQTTYRWIQDGARRTWASYAPERLLCKEAAAGSDGNVLRDLRQANIGEIEVAFGYARDHTGPAVPSAQLKSGKAYRLRQQLLEKASLPRLLWQRLGPALQTRAWDLEVASLADYLH